MDFIINNLLKIADLPRHLISDGYDEALGVIQIVAAESGLELKIHSYPTGYDCGTWIVPEKWTLKRAQLKNMKGQVLIDSEMEPSL